jgi:hypothetical protein
MPRRNSTIRAAVAAFALIAPLGAPGCAAVLVGAAAGGGYETVQAQEMDKLEEDYKAARISKQEYEARKDQIDKSSLFQ